MAKQKIPLLAIALEQKKQDLTKLLLLRKEVMGHLVIAREMGDLSENGAYKAAKFELGGINRRIRQLNFVLDNAFVPEVNKLDIASFGKVVTLKNGTNTLTFTLVGSYESDPEQMKFSLESPLGKAVEGRKVGDKVMVNSPAGEVKYLIVEIK